MSKTTKGVIVPAAIGIQDFFPPSPLLSPHLLLWEGVSSLCFAVLHCQLLYASSQRELVNVALLTFTPVLWVRTKPHLSHQDSTKVVHRPSAGPLHKGKFHLNCLHSCSLLGSWGYLREAAAMRMKSSLELCSPFLHQNETVAQHIGLWVHVSDVVQMKSCSGALHLSCRHWSSCKLKVL